jgi:hypothetical protein
MKTLIFLAILGSLVGCADRPMATPEAATVPTCCAAAHYEDAHHPCAPYQTDASKVDEWYGGTFCLCPDPQNPGANPEVDPALILPWCPTTF